MKQLFPRNGRSALGGILLVASLAMLFLIAFSLFQPWFLVSADVTLTLTPITWNIVGLDSNNVNVGPNQFPVGARVCNTGGTAAADVSSAFVWDSADSYIDLRPGSNSSYAGLSLAAGSCKDIYYDVQVTRNSAAYYHTRKYHITATESTAGTVSTTTPREIFVERLISQNRNAISDIQLDGVSYASGSSMSLIVGSTYNMKLIGSTATQGYNQIESFINLPNAIFRINSVAATYSAGSGFADTLYADACSWDNNPASITYRSCIGSDNKNGGNLSLTFNLTVIGGAGTSHSLTSMVYDFSGSSFHYNADYSTSARIASITSPVTVSKAFSPASIIAGGTSSLTFTLTNSGATSISGINITDNLPASPGQMTVAATTSSTTGCGSATLVATAGATSISFSNGTIAAGAACTFTVSVTAPSNGAYTNTTNHLLVNSVDTGYTATATLYVSNTSSGAPVCNQTLAQWNFSIFTTDITLPPAPSAKASNVGTAAITVGGASPGALVEEADTSSGNPAPSLLTYGWPKDGPITPATFPYIQFAIDTRHYSQVSMSFDAQRKNPGPASSELFYSTDESSWSSKTTFSSTTSWASYGAYSFTGQTNTAGITYFRIYGYGANNTSKGADLNLDNVTFRGCGAGKATIAKAFSPGKVSLNGTSILTFTLANPNATPLTGAAFSDTLPGGLEVAATPSASTTCSGSPTFNPSAGDTTLTLSGATIPAGGSCTAQVSVKATSLGPHLNVTGFISTTETGTNTGSSGSASSTLTAVQAPTITKSFSANPITAGGTSTLTFAISNPNAGDSLTSVAFTDTFPTSPANMVVAGTPNAFTSGCGSPTFSPSAGSGSISMSGGTILAGSTCTVKVTVTATHVGGYSNTSAAVTATVSGTSLTGNTASDTLILKPAANPGIKLAKQVSNSASGPWSPFRTLTPTTDNLYYRLIVENIGDVTLSPVTVTDAAVSLAGCSWSSSLASLAAGDSSTCIVNPGTAQTGDHINTATAQGTYNGTNYTAYASAEYVGLTSSGSPGLTLYKQISYSASGPWSTSITNPGSSVYYRFTVINTGNQPLTSVQVSDNPLGALASCSFSSSLAPGAATACVYGPVAANTSVATHPNTATAQGTYGGNPYSSVSSASYTVTSPTAVLLANFTAQGSDKGILLEWQTMQELEGIGFNVYRASTAGGTRQRLNANLLSVKNPGMPLGADYRLVDNTALPRVHYYYWLEVVLQSGPSEYFGPIRASWQEGPAHQIFLPWVPKTAP